MLSLPVCAREMSEPPGTDGAVGSGNIAPGLGEPDGSETPFASLAPERVLAVLEKAGFPVDGRLSALNSYENRVYQAGTDDGFVVVKFYRPARWTDAQIHEEHAFLQALAAEEIPVVPPLIATDGTSLYHAEGHRFAVFPRRGGRAPECEDEATLAWIGRFIGRIHAVGRVAPFDARPALNAATFGDDSIAWIKNKLVMPEAVGPAYLAEAERALAQARRLFEQVQPLSTLRAHGDCHLGNILWTDDGPHFVDFDDARTAPAVQDLWMLLVGDENERRRRLGALLDGYEQFHTFDYRELRLIEAYRTLRLIHYAAWLARRWNDPAFPRAFPWFGTADYWRERTAELEGQTRLMEDEEARSGWG